MCSSEERVHGGVRSGREVVEVVEVVVVLLLLHCLLAAGYLGDVLRVEARLYVKRRDDERRRRRRIG